MGLIPEKIERLIFPGFLFIFEVLMLILFGALVRYAPLGTPLPVNVTAEEFRDGDPLDPVAHVEQTYPLFQDIHVMIFIGFGFLMTFLRRYGYSSVSFNFLVAAFVIQWATIIRGVFGFIEVCCTIHATLETMVNADFAAAVVLITMGALLGRISHFQLIIVALFEVLFYAANEALNNHLLKATDIGGSMIIHTFGAYFGLAVSTVLFKKKASDHSRNSSVYHADLFSMIGTVFLWLFWPSFNAVLAEGDGKYRTLINTYYSMTGSVISSFLLSILFSDKKKLDMVHVQNATLAGGVAVGAVANMMLQPWGAMFVGFSGGIISVVGFRFLSPLMEKIFILDTCGVHNLHGMPGVFSGLVSVIGAAVASESLYGQSLSIITGGDRTPGQQAGFQLATLVATLVIAIVGGLLTGLIVRFLPILQSTSDDELFDDEPYWELADDADTYLPLTSGAPAENDVIVKTQGKDIVLQYSGSASQPPKE